MSKFAERLKELRQERGLTQVELAKASGVPQTTISGYELNKNRPTDETIIIFAKFFNVTAGYLCGLED